MVLHHHFGVTHLAPGATHHITNGVIFGKHKFCKYNISHRPDEAMLFVIVQICLCYQIIVLFRTQKDFILLINGHKHNYKPSSTQSFCCFLLFHEYVCFSNELTNTVAFLGGILSTEFLYRRQYVPRSQKVCQRCYSPHASQLKLILFINSLQKYAVHNTKMFKLTVKVILLIYFIIHILYYVVSI